MMLPVGTVQTLTVERKIDTGYVLTYNTEEVLLHHNETESELEVGSEVDVFLYTDKNEQVVATTVLPEIEMDTYGWAEVIEVIPKLGVFVSIGTTKDLLVSSDDLPFLERVWPEKGAKLYVTLGRDQRGRLLAIPAGEREMERVLEYVDSEDVSLNQEVSGPIYFTDKEGSVMLTKKNYRGFIHHTEREREPRLGEHVTGRIIEVKEDGTLNVSLLPLKHERIDDDAELILAYLNEHGGEMPFTDKSSPHDIRNTFKMSKSAFKRALGRLMRERKIEQTDEKTVLVNKEI